MTWIKHDVGIDTSLEHDVALTGSLVVDGKVKLDNDAITTLTNIPLIGKSDHFTIKPYLSDTNSTTTFDVTQFDGTSIFRVDTFNNKIILGDDTEFDAGKVSIGSIDLGDLEIVDNVIGIKEGSRSGTPHVQIDQLLVQYTESDEDDLFLIRDAAGNDILSVDAGTFNLNTFGDIIMLNGEKIRNGTGAYTNNYIHFSSDDMRFRITGSGDYKWLDSSGGNIAHLQNDGKWIGTHGEKTFDYQRWQNSSYITIESRNDQGVEIKPANTDSAAIYVGGGNAARGSAGRGEIAFDIAKSGGSRNTVLYLDEERRVGINTTAPEYALDITTVPNGATGNARIKAGDSTDARLLFSGADGVINSGVGLNGDSYDLELLTTKDINFYTNSDMHDGAPTNIRMKLFDTGKLYLGEVVESGDHQFVVQNTGNSAVARFESTGVTGAGISLRYDPTSDESWTTPATIDIKDQHLLFQKTNLGGIGVGLADLSANYIIQTQSPLDNGRFAWKAEGHYSGVRTGISITPGGSNPIIAQTENANNGLIMQFDGFQFRKQVGGVTDWVHFKHNTYGVTIGSGANWASYPTASPATDGLLVKGKTGIGTLEDGNPPTANSQLTVEIPDADTYAPLSLFDGYYGYSFGNGSLGATDTNNNSFRLYKNSSKVYIDNISGAGYKSIALRDVRTSGSVTTHMMDLSAVSGNKTLVRIGDMDNNTADAVLRIQTANTTVFSPFTRDHDLGFGDYNDNFNLSLYNAGGTSTATNEFEQYATLAFNPNNQDSDNETHSRLTGLIAVKTVSRLQGNGEIHFGVGCSAGSAGATRKVVINNSGINLYNAFIPHTDGHYANLSDDGARSNTIRFYGINRGNADHTTQAAYEDAQIDNTNGSNSALYRQGYLSMSHSGTGRDRYGKFEGYLGTGSTWDAHEPSNTDRFIYVPSAPTGDAILSVFLGVSAGDGNPNYSVAIGHEALKTEDSGYNVAMGYKALKDLDAGLNGNNVAIGTAALLRATTILNTTAVGHEAGYYLDDGVQNTIIGSKAAWLLESGDSNVIIGYNAGYNAESSSNTYIGESAGEHITTGGSNVGVGFKALYNGSSTTANNIGYGNIAVGNSVMGNETDVDFIAHNNVAIGNEAFKKVQSSTYSVVIGSSAGDTITTGSGNSVIGYKSGQKITTADYNTALGYEALMCNGGSLASGADNAGNYNIAIGYRSLYTLSNAVAGSGRSAKNVAIGSEAGSKITIGKQNTLVGHAAGQSVSYSNNTFVGSTSGTGWYNTYASVLVGSSTGGNYGGASYTVGIGMGALSNIRTNTGITALSDHTPDVIGGPWNNATNTDVTVASDTSVNGTGAKFTVVTSGGNPTFTITTPGYGYAVSDVLTIDDPAGSGNSTEITVSIVENDLNSGTVAIGYNSGYDITTGHSNVLIGDQSGHNLTTGYSNVVIGTIANDAGTTANKNVAIGDRALYTEDTGRKNVAVGYKALEDQNSDVDNFNTAIGYEAAKNVSTGICNTVLGSCGTTITTGSNNITVGHLADVSAGDITQSTALGAFAVTQQSYDSRVGNYGGFQFFSHVMAPQWLSGDDGDVAHANYLFKLPAKGIIKSVTAIVTALSGATTFKCRLVTSDDDSTTAQGNPPSGSIVEILGASKDDIGSADLDFAANVNTAHYNNTPEAIGASTRYVWLVNAGTANTGSVTLSPKVRICIEYIGQS